MDIAVVGPSPVPFTIGGMEQLLGGIAREINNRTTHRAELFKLPTREGSFWDLIRSYRMYYEFDLSHFDMVISAKYPCWMIQHPNHVLYMAHRLRGLYDTYPYAVNPHDSLVAHPLVQQIRRYMSQKHHSHLREFFAMMDQLHAVQHELPNTLFQFPGPFIREIIHFLDDWALDPKRTSRHASISQTVVKRADYFPSDVNVKVIYPPTSFEGLGEGNYDYLLIVGRLDNAKRTWLAVEAMKHVKQDVTLKVVGAGPEEEKLRSLAGDDRRIEFLGRVNERVAVQLYRNALAVIYVPYDEDYGLVTVEAMMCKKPVITCSDSGGTLEFVRHLENGYIASPNPKSIAKGIQFMLDNRESLVKLGGHGQETVRSIEWGTVIGELIDLGAHGSQGSQHAAPAISRASRKMTLLSTYPIRPRGHGGQLRTYHLYSNMVRSFRTEIISYSNTEVGFVQTIAPNMQEYCFTRSHPHVEGEAEVQHKIGIPVTDIVMSDFSRLTPAFGAHIHKAAADTDLFVLVQPYLVGDLPDHPQIPVIYDAQNVEYDLKKQLLPDSKTGQEYLQKVYELEKRACDRASLIMACSEEDRIRMAELYQVPLDKIIVVPNGVNIEEYEFVDYEERMKRKAEVGIEEPLALFIGSWHPPNIKAVKQILAIAKQTPEVNFIIAGSVCGALKGLSKPSNVAFAGTVSDRMKTYLYTICDIALNPMEEGAGTNLKMFDYMAAGMPILATSVGARGTGAQDRVHYYCCDDMQQYPQALRDLLQDRTLRTEMVKEARKWAEDKFDWKVIAANAEQKINSL
ncbi:MAG: glycosyltransferase [Tumebacillaceae bacterium]